MCAIFPGFLKEEKSDEGRELMGRMDFGQSVWKEASLVDVSVYDVIGTETGEIRRKNRKKNFDRRLW